MFILKRIHLRMITSLSKYCFFPFGNELTTHSQEVIPLIDSGIVVASGISTIMAFVSSFILFRHYIHYKKDTPTHFWALAMFFYAIGHFIVVLLYAEILENSILTMFIYVNSSGAITMSLFLFGALYLFIKQRKIIIAIPTIYGSFYFMGSALYGFIVPEDSFLNFINISGDISALNNMSWFVVETLILASFFLSLLFLKDFTMTKNHSSFWVSLHFFLYLILLFIWPFPALKLLFYLGRTLATSCLLIGFTSLTQQRRLEGIIHEFESAESDFFLDLLTHDIKNHLQGVKMVTEFYNTDKDVKSLEFFDIIDNNVNYISDLISNIEKYRTVQKAGYFTLLYPIQLIPVIEKTMEYVISIYPKKAVEYQLNLNQTMNYWITGNEFIEDIFNNLFSNAIKHHDKDRVHIQIKIESLFSRGVDYWVVIIIDNGLGIPEEKKKHLFTGKLRKNGSGIGLSIVKNIIDGYRGKIFVRNRISEEDKVCGSIFEIYFPKAEEKHGEQA
jgi:signal transduction histidine kinase